MMRRSFSGGDGAGSRGGGMLRSVHKAVRRVGSGGESFSRSTSPPKTTSPKSPTKTKTANILSISNCGNNTAPFYSPFQLPFATASDCSSEEFGEWECIDNGEVVNDKDVGFYYDDNVFGSVPSPDEVQHAVSSLHRVLDPISYSHFIKDNPVHGSEKDLSYQTKDPTGFLHRVPSCGSEVDWMEPSLQLCDAKLVNRSDRLYDAFHLLQTEPLVKRMVLSLSSDRAVWDAVLNNEVVREVKQTLAEAESSVSVSSLPDDESEGTTEEGTVDILTWIFGNTKAKLMELVDKITKMVDELFLHTKNEKKSEQVVDSCFEERLRTSFMLSVVVFLIVVVSRARRA